MRALLAQDLPKGPEWHYELKLDGVRAVVIKDGVRISLLSRTANDFAGKYPELVDCLRELPARQAVLDGEIVALDEQCRPSFQVLQAYHLTSPRPPLLYYAFDALNLEGKDLRALPFEKRRAIAGNLISGLSPRVRLTAAIDASKSELLRQLQARGLEGLVAKLKDSTYEAGRRSGAWLKYKWSNEQEFVIGGFTRPKGARTHFGALLVGYFDKGRLIFAGKVGTGFDERMLETLFRKFQSLVRPDCPFANLPEQSIGSGRGLTRSQMRLCTWVQPRLVCQVRFAEWTRDHLLRQPAFLGLREDKDPAEVVRERVKQ
jgi:bifunctional non-homologous end joining protein LigD